MNYFEKHGKIRFVLAVATGVAYGIALGFREIGYCCWYPAAALGVCGSLTWLGMVIYAFRNSKIE